MPSLNHVACRDVLAPPAPLVPVAQPAATRRLRLIDTAALHHATRIDLADWPAEQLWLHPDGAAFCDHRTTVEDVLRAHLAELPRKLRAGPLGCATPPNVSDFLRDGQADRAWRLAARLFLAARSEACGGSAGQVADDLAISALLLAGEIHGCVIGGMEAAVVMGGLADRAVGGGVAYPGLRLPAGVLAVRIHRRRQAVVERLQARMAVDGGSPGSVEALMWRAPVAQNPLLTGSAKG